MRDRDRITFRTLATGVALTLVLGTAAPTLGNDGDDLVERNDTTYRLLLDKGVLRAESTLKLTNKSKPIKTKRRCKGGRSICTTTTRYYFTGWNSFWAPGDATNVAVGGSKVKPQPAQPHGDGMAYPITFPKLWNKKGAKHVATFGFDLEAGTVEDADRPTRIEDGYAFFCWWGQVGDTGVTRAILPPGWEPMDRRDNVVIEQGASGTVLRARSTKEPSDFEDCVEVFDPDRLDKTYVTGEAGKSLMVIEAWPTDSVWAEAMTGVTVEALPNLEALLGTPLPGGELRVREVATQSRRYDYGDRWPTNGVLGMGEDASSDMLPSRLARMWIDPEQVTDRWLVEGLASWLATQAIAGMTCADPIAHPGPEAPDLDAWTDVTSAELVALGNWQLVTACNLVATGAEVLGDDAMLELIHELIEAPVPVDTSHWLAGVSRDLPEGLDTLVAALDAAGVDR